MDDILKNEPLYTNVPPTRLRNREEKFRKAKWIPFWMYIAKLFFHRMLENRFFALRYRNYENFTGNYNPAYPCIFYAPHTNWWDGIVCFNLSSRLFKTRITMMIEEMNRFPLFNFAGAFPVNKKSPQAAMVALKHAVEILSNPRNKDVALWIFPQGIIRPPNYRPIEFQTGMVYIAQQIIKQVGGINLVPLSYQYTFLREDRPEVLVDIGKPLILTNPNIDRHEMTKSLETSFTNQCDAHAASVFSGQIKDYKVLYMQKLAWYRKLEKRLKSIGIAQNSSSSPSSLEHLPPPRPVKK